MRVQKCQPSLPRSPPWVLDRSAAKPENRTIPFPGASSWTLLSHISPWGKGMWVAGGQSSNNKVTPSSKMSLSRSMWWLWGCHLSQVNYLRGLTYRAASGPQTAPGPQGQPHPGRALLQWAL